MVSLTQLPALIELKIPIFVLIKMVKRLAIFGISIRLYDNKIKRYSEQNNTKKSYF